MGLRKNIIGLAALLAVFASRPALAIPPPPVDSTLNQARLAIAKLKPILGDWTFDRSYKDGVGYDREDHLEIKAVQLDYIVYISVVINNTLGDFYTIEYNSARKSYRILLGGVDYIQPDPALESVNLDVQPDGISWVVPDVVDGKDDPSLASTYSIKLSGDQLIETEDVPSGPGPERIKTVYTLHRANAG